MRPRRPGRVDVTWGLGSGCGRDGGRRSAVRYTDDLDSGALRDGEPITRSAASTVIDHAWPNGHPPDVAELDDQQDDVWGPRTPGSRRFVLSAVGRCVAGAER